MSGFGQAPVAAHLLSNVSGTVTGNSFWGALKDMTVHAGLYLPSGTATVSVDIEVSNLSTHWLRLGTIALTQNTTHDGFCIAAKWLWWRARVTQWQASDPETTLSVTIAGL